MPTIPCRVRSVAADIAAWAWSIAAAKATSPGFAEPWQAARVDLAVSADASYVFDLISVVPERRELALERDAELVADFRRALASFNELWHQAGATRGSGAGRSSLAAP